jgi:xanthine dehydrogenase molybdenum-binding subunit
MALAGRIDPFRVATDAAYADSLTPAQWRALGQDPEFQQLMAEQNELVAHLIPRYGLHMGMMQPATPPLPAPSGPFQIIGKKVPRVHGLGIVAGYGQYTEQMRMSGMLFTRTLRSPYPHAKVTSLDVSKAEQFPGVHAVLHRGNMPAEYRDVKLGSGPPDRFLFNEEVWEVGSPVAVVAAESEHIADEAVRLIEVQYEVLPAVLDFMEGAKSSTQKQWDNRLDGTIISVTPPLVRGNPDSANADIKIDAVSGKSTENHVALEPTTSIAYWDNDKLVFTSTSQYAHGIRQGLSQALKLPQNKVRVIQPGYMGSGYGFRSGIELPEVHTALLAKMTGRPVKTMYTRAEDMIIRMHRPQFRDEMSLGVNRDGTIVYGKFKVYANVGAQRAGAANGSWFNMQDQYTIPNLKLEAVDVFTNSYKSGPYRCVSHPNGTFAMETLMEKAAYQVGMDPVEFRLKNLNEVGNPDTQKPFSNPGLREVITQATDHIGWKQNWHPAKAREVRPGVFHGIGMAAHSCSHGGGGNPITGQVIVNVDGSVQAVTAANEIGGGQRTLAAMVTAESLGVPLPRVTITPYIDTDYTTDVSGTFGSIQTNTGSYAMYMAAQDAKRQILEVAAKQLEVAPSTLDIKDGKIVGAPEGSEPMTVADALLIRRGPVVGQYVGTQDPRWERTAWASHAAEIEVDTVTGQISILRYVAAHDVGRALNPFALEQQIEGGVVMALGAVLNEEMLVDQATGLPLNANLLDYKPLSIKDAPRNIEVVLVEKPKEYGTFGAHGIGEPPMSPPAPTIANAVYNAVGVWMDSMPITREKLLAALKNVR